MIRLYNHWHYEIFFASLSEKPISNLAATKNSYFLHLCVMYCIKFLPIINQALYVDKICDVVFIRPNVQQTEVIIEILVSDSKCSDENELPTTNCKWPR